MDIVAFLWKLEENRCPNGLLVLSKTWLNQEWVEVYQIVSAYSLFFSQFHHQANEFCSGARTIHVWGVWIHDQWTHPNSVFPNQGLAFLFHHQEFWKIALKSCNSIRFFNTTSLNLASRCAEWVFQNLIVWIMFNNFRGTSHFPDNSIHHVVQSEIVDLGELGTNMITNAVNFWRRQRRVALFVYISYIVHSVGLLGCWVVGLLSKLLRKSKSTSLFKNLFGIFISSYQLWVCRMDRWVLWLMLWLIGNAVTVCWRVLFNSLAFVVVLKVFCFRIFGRWRDCCVVWLFERILRRWYVTEIDLRVLNGYGNVEAISKHRRKSQQNADFSTKWCMKMEFDSRTKINTDRAVRTMKIIRGRDNEGHQKGMKKKV